MKVDEIRAKYPNPIATQQLEQENTYCVGGAFCLFKGQDMPFPDEDELTLILIYENPKLAEKIDDETNRSFARYYTALIIDKNDTNQFEYAWKYLEKALNYGK